MIKRIFLVILMLFSGLLLVACKNSDIDAAVQPTAVVISSPEQTNSITVGMTLQLRATVIPTTITNITVDWSSNNEEVATVSDEGLVTALQSGQVKITAKAGTVSGYYYLTVKEDIPVIQAIAIEGVNEVFVGDYLKLNYRLTPDVNVAVVWTVDKTNIAEIDQNGRLYGKSAGTVTVTAAYENINTSRQITVKTRTGNPTALTLKGRNLLEAGATMQLLVTTTPVGAVNGVTFTSSNDEIAEVSASGLVLGKSAGTVTITARSTEYDLEANFEITIKDYRIDENDYQNVWKDVLAATKDSIFGVAHYQNNDQGKLVKKSIGSGFVYKTQFIMKDGSIYDDINDVHSFDDVEFYHYYLITNKHVVEGSDALKIYLHAERKEIPATLIQYDTKVDLAVVSFNYTQYIRPLSFGDSDNLLGGERVAAIGNPSGFEFSSSITEGIVSIPRIYMDDDTDNDGINDWSALYIMHNADINPGNSGGPLVNSKGEVLAINTMKFVSSNIEGMGFSIPIHLIQSLLPYLENGVVKQRVTLGITGNEVKTLVENHITETVDSENNRIVFSIPEGIDYGVYVVGVDPSSKAGQAGLQIHDIILTINGRKVWETLDIRSELDTVVPGSGQEVRLGVMRNGVLEELILTY
ncbi:MAG: trypsin-like serine protease [Acholeplasmataceae bacterium]|nr:trypsin-like serine protease [Acholeplasmataceae bacterium]